jgi:putative AbiEii toxin of type IV toxin-antitoxin system
MLLREFAVENFRPFEAAEVRLPGSGLVLVAGAINAGKSALLSALDVVAGVGSDTTAWRRAGSSQPARVSATFDLSAEERFTLLAASDRRAELMERGIANQLKFVFEEQAAGNPLLANVLGSWPVEGFQPLATTGLRETQPGLYGIKVIRGLLPGIDDIDVRLLVDRGSGGWGGPIALETIMGSEPVPELNPMMQLRAAWGSRYYHFRPLRPGTQRSVGLTVAPTLAPTGENLAAVLLDLLTNRPGIFQELRRLIAEIVPDIGQLEIRTSGSTMQVVFASGGMDLNLKDLGTGVEQLLMTLVVGLTEAAPFTLVIEEPETNLHHAAQRALLGLLKDWAADRQIVAVTHSPVLLDWSPAGERLWHVTKAQGVSTVTPVRDDPSVLLDALGVRLSDVLSATRVLVVEGQSDAEVLGIWFPEILRSPAVAVLRGRGGDNARYADRLAEWLADVDRIGLRRVLYLRDRDELSPLVLKALQDSRTVEVLQRRELENYLLDPSAVATVLGPLAETKAAPPSAADVAAAMNQAAESLRTKIVVNRVCRQVHPARPLMEHSLRQRLAHNGADIETVTTAMLERLLTQDELRAQIKAAWEAAEADVASRSGDELLAIAPGEEILNAVFMRFARRGYKKREDGLAIAKAMAAPPEEIQTLLQAFMLDDPRS